MGTAHEKGPSMSKGTRRAEAALAKNKRYLDSKDTAIHIRRRAAAKNPRRPELRIEDPTLDAPARRLEERTWTAQVCGTCFLAMPCGCQD